MGQDNKNRQYEGQYSNINCSAVLYQWSRHFTESASVDKARVFSWYKKTYSI